MPIHPPKMTGWTKLTLVLLLCLAPIFGFAAVQIVSGQNYHNSDFFTFWLSARMNWTGQNPYAPDQWVAGHHQYGVDWIPNPVFPYPLPLAVLLAPIGLLPLKDAYILWVAVSAIVITLEMLWLLNTFQATARQKHFILPFVVASFLFRPTIVILRNGQLGAFLLLASVVCLVLWQKQKWWQGGIILSVLVLKPTLGLPILSLVGLWLLLRKKYSTILAMLVGLVGLVLIGLIRDIRWIGQFLAYGQEKLAANFGYSPTVWGISGLACSHQVDCTTVFGGLFSGLIVIAVIALIFVQKEVQDPSAVMSLAIPVTLLVTPYIWAYDQILLLVPIGLTAIALSKRGSGFLAAALFPMLFSILSLGLLYISSMIANDAWSVLVPGLCLAMGVWLLFTADHPHKMK